MIAYGVFSDDPAASQKIKEFFDQFQELPKWFTNLWILVVASIYGIKGTQIFKGGKIMPGKEIKGRSKRAMYSNGKLVGGKVKIAKLHQQK